jgi:inner membrane protein
VVETENFYASTVVDSLGPEVDPTGDMRIRYKPAETPVTLAAKRSYLGRVYLDWAKYPVTETEEIENPRPGYIVRFEDLRFAYPERKGTNLLRGGVQFDRNLNIVTETFGSRGKQLPD